MANQYCDFYTQNYGTILLSDKENVKAYIENNIDEYVGKILLNSEVTCESESSENMLQLLNNEQISLKYRKSLLAKIKIIFSDVKEFSYELFEALFANNRIVPTWRNIQVAYEIKGFECVKEFIKRNDTITGGIVGVEGIKDETPMQIINSMLKEFNEEDIIVVSKTLPAIAPLCGLELAKIDDVVLAEFIRLGKTKYSNDDFALLIEKPKSLCEYIINHTKKIEENFDGFFSEELPQDCYAAIIGYTGIDILIKKKLIETDCNFNA